MINKVMYFPHRKSGPATSNFERKFPPLFYVKNTNIHCMWKVHIISTFFSESVAAAQLEELPNHEFLKQF